MIDAAILLDMEIRIRSMMPVIYDAICENMRRK